MRWSSAAYLTFIGPSPPDGEAGCPVLMNVLVSDLELEDPRDVDARSFAIVDDGLPLFSCAQLAIETMVVGDSMWCGMVVLPSELRRRRPSERDNSRAHSLQRTCGLRQSTRTQLFKRHGADGGVPIWRFRRHVLSQRLQ